MMEEMDKRAKIQFSQFFRAKGGIAPIAEKAGRNLKLKEKATNKEQHVHHFAVGHSFKQLDCKNIFDWRLDSGKTEHTPHRLLALQQDNFHNISKELSDLIEAIRNVNSHYMHSFEVLRIEEKKEKEEKKGNAKLVPFITDTFTLAVEQAYLTREKKSYAEWMKDDETKRNTAFVTFLRDSFMPDNDKRKDWELDDAAKEKRNKYREERSAFLTKTRTQAIAHILYIDVATPFDWPLYGDHSPMPICAGRYLSLEACLFVLSLFLYKHEAKLLIGKIRGFKRDDDDKYRSKLNIFTFFAKRFSSQDVDSEQRHAVRFRDIMQYLGKYPTLWNKELEAIPTVPLPTNAPPLLTTIIEQSIEQYYPCYKGDALFMNYAKKKLFKIEGPKLTKSERRLPQASEGNTAAFAYEIETCKRVKDADNKLKELKPNNGYERERLEKIIEENKDERNQSTLKLEKRLAENSFVQSWGRNQDRFIETATRFLFESNYFGADAAYKCYQYYNPSEWEEVLKAKKEELGTDAALKHYTDKIHFHDGRPTHYTTQKAHKDSYPEWDTPFVVQNNAIQIQIRIAGKDVTLSVQRDLLRYLLQDALYNATNEETANKGCNRIQGYYKKLICDKKDAFASLDSRTASTQDIAITKKILPKRLIDRYIPHTPDADRQSEAVDALQAILAQAQTASNRYQTLHDKAKAKGEEALAFFEKRNKGKQFKLRFVRKAWHLMYLRAIYDQKKKNVSKKAGEKDPGHHTSHHLSREEAAQCSQWLFAFDAAPQYKDYITSLFRTKGFLANAELEKLLCNATNLNQLYTRTLALYTTWLQSPQRTSLHKEGKHQLESYTNILESIEGGKSKMLYINLSHFLAYWDTLRGKVENSKRIYPSLVNEKHLIAQYYEADKGKQRQQRLLYNEALTAKLEDTLLYELAMHYLGQSGASLPYNESRNVFNILNEELQFSIMKAHKPLEKLYTLSVPFKHIDSYVELVAAKARFLTNIPAYLYLCKAKDEKDLKTGNKNDKTETIWSVYNPTNTLSFDQLGKINTHLMTTSAQYTQIALSIEAFLIHKNKHKVENILCVDKNRITIDNISDFSCYVDKLDRNKAFHFGIPNSLYSCQTKVIEEKFKAKEKAELDKCTNFDQLPAPHEAVCTALLDTIHGECFEHKKGDERTKTQKRQDARNKYFSTIIKGKRVIFKSK